MWSNILIDLGGVILTVAIYLLIGKFYPTGKGEYFQDTQVDFSSKKYVKYELLAVPLIFITWGGIGYLTYLLGIFLNSQIAVSRAYELFYKPDELAWLFPGGFLTIALSLPVLDGMYSLMLGKQYPSYKVNANRKHGYDGAKLIKHMFVFFFTIAFAGYFKMFTTYTAVNKDTLVYSPLFGFKNEYKLADIDKVILYHKFIAPNGNVVVRDHYVLHHKTEGTIYNSDNAIAQIDEHLPLYILDINKLNLTELELNEE